MDPITTAAVAGAALVASSALQSAGDGVGKASVAAVTRLTTRIRDRFRGDPQAVAALQRAVESPEDEVARDGLQRLLHAYMLQDRAFESELRAMIDEAIKVQGSPGGGSVNAAVIKNVQVNHGKVEVKGDLNFS
ncbi:hypothetical protein [Streptacidiphilus sp. MAP5-3]|uniref:hypothetical protein n=1 Tax=unclassified Streptacidiphilus TaxID=2643834 RepID=UPI003518CBFC